MRLNPESITPTQIQQVMIHATSDFDLAAEAEADAETAMNIASRTLDQCDRAMHSTDPSILHHAKLMVCVRWNEWYGTLE